MSLYQLFFGACLILAMQVSLSVQQHQDYTTPVPILKQIDKQNEDGSYTFGYEGADGSFKIETKYANGEVYGKYGYVDDQGKVREVEYGATKRGFEPAGNHINVPPPTLTNSNPYPLGPNEIDDGQYREDPSVYYKDQKFNRPITPASKFSLNQGHQQQYNPAPKYYNPPQQQQQQPAPQPYYQPRQTNYYQPPAPQHQYQLQHQPRQYQQQQQQQQQQPQYQPQYQQQQQPQPLYNPYNSNSIPQHFHPAVKSLDIWSGSYSLDYTGRK